jgi:N-acetylneuraminic acid mutarotase
MNSLRNLLVALLVGVVCPIAVHAQGKWMKAAPFPEPGEELLGAAANGKMYVFCGLAPGWKPIGMVYEYDPATDKWTKKKPMALASHHVAFTEMNGKIYAFGGFVPPESGPPAWVPINNAWEYDPAADTWKALAPMPTKRGSPVAVAVDGKIYVIGGATTPPNQPDVTAVHPARPHVVLGTVEEYDPATNTWRARTSMPTPRNHAVGGAVNGKVYVIGGRVGGAFIGIAADIDVVEEYDPATDKWGATRARMPTPRSAMAAAVYNGKIYVEGGEGQTPVYMMTFRSLEAYDPAANRWTVLQQMPTSRHGLAGAAIGNKVHMVSGDVQSAGSGVEVHSDAHDVYEIEVAR